MARHIVLYLYRLPAMLFLSYAEQFADRQLPFAGTRSRWKCQFRRGTRLCHHHKASIDKIMRGAKISS